jgi:hypothetical protein
VSDKAAGKVHECACGLQPQGGSLHSCACHERPRLVPARACAGNVRHPTFSKVCVPASARRCADYASLWRGVDSVS